jgi:hypothetical protein
MLKPIDRTTEQSLFEEIDPKELQRHTEEFVGLERVSGSDDEWEASEYIVEVLSEYGVDARLEEFEGYVSVPEDAGLEVTTPTKRTIEDVITVSFSASTSSAGVHGDVVLVEEADESLTESNELDEKIAFVRDTPKPHTVGIVERAGPKAVIYQSPNEHCYQGIVTPVWGTPSPDTADRIPDIPVAETNAPNGEWLADRLEHGPVEATVRTEVTTELTTLPCPVGRIEGADSDRYFVIGNHVDSWFEGITDNATAMAVTLEIARIYARREPSRGLVFGFWPAHSTGRYAGSSWWADQNWLDLRENGVAYLHIDLPGLKGANSLWYQHMAELADEHFDAMETATDLELREQEESYLGATGRPARNSDQSFWGTGLSSLLSGARLTPETEEGGPIGGGWWWHTPEDTIDKVDYDVLIEETKLYLAMAARLCESPILPHDYRATVEDIQTNLDAIEAAADGTVSFNDVQADLNELKSALEELAEATESRDLNSDGPAIEDLQVKLGNVINPALYMEASEYEHEPRRPYRQLPYLRVAETLPELTGLDRRFAETKVQRGRVKLAHRVQRATALTRAFLDE